MAYYRGWGGPLILAVQGKENIYRSLLSLNELGKPKRKAKHSYNKPKYNVLKTQNLELPSLSMKSTISHKVLLTR